MDTITVTTPSGYTAYIRSALTFGQYTAIQEVLLASMKIDPNTKTVSLIDGLSTVRASRKAVECLVEKIVDKNGTTLSGGPIEAMYDMAVDDARVILEKVNEIRLSSEVTKKNLIAS